ncbi:uncharacterized protein LOC115898324 [Rhinopithecus roxellana]|uniref:uncharacterized protein LOC115898324 n=1 Tax=Rhinopithecus roxellana TaxID=61622 RepID=UPI001237468A|nr:uncharacterized protein LOC115898324 [Rhinopithecus roxellana]
MPAGQSESGPGVRASRLAGMAGQRGLICPGLNTPGGGRKAGDRRAPSKLQGCGASPGTGNPQGRANRQQPVIRSCLRDQKRGQLARAQAQSLLRILQEEPQKRTSAARVYLHAGRVLGQLTSAQRFLRLRGSGLSFSPILALALDSPFPFNPFLLFWPPKKQSAATPDFFVWDTLSSHSKPSAAAIFGKS